MNDLIYLGNDWEKDYDLKVKFLSDIQKKFPEVVLENADDDIKGFRESITLQDNHKEDYLSWLVGSGWYNNSLQFQLILLDPDRKLELKTSVDLAKRQYPDVFKKIYDNL